jgi:site-specific DNA recombinase
MSGIYNIFANTFYAGIITRRGRTYQGKHQPMITLDEFEKVQAILGRPMQARPQVRTFAFTGMMKCGHCGCAITAEEHVKLSGLHFVYYRCGRKKRAVKCTQPAVALRELERQIIAFLEGISIPEEIHQWALGRLDRWGHEEAKRNLSSRESLQAAFDTVTKQLETVRELRVILISDEEFIKDREALQAEKRKLAQRLENNETVDSWFEPARLLILFSRRAVSWFREGNLDVKRLIFSVAGLNPTLFDRQLNIDARKPFQRLFETARIPAMSSMLEDVRTLWQAHDQEFRETVDALRRLMELVNPAEAARAS